MDRPSHKFNRSRRVHPDDLILRGCGRCRCCRRRAARRSFATSVALAVAIASGGLGPFLLTVSGFNSPLPSGSANLRAQQLQSPSPQGVATAAPLASYGLCTINGGAAFPAAGGSRIQANQSKRCTLSASESQQSSSEPVPARHLYLPISRPHERSIFLFYVVLGAALTSFGATSALARAQVESFLALMWSSFVLAISFLEAWVKFKAPFLRKHVAVDVGRHVFATLNSAELALASVLWAGRLLAGAASTVGEASSGPFCLLVSIINKLTRQAFVLPAAATAVLLSQVALVEPKLNLRAKATIVNGFRESTAGSLNEEEEQSLRSLVEEIENQKLPSVKWHFVYVVMEMIKVTCLLLFALTSWKV